MIDRGVSVGGVCESDIVPVAVFLASGVCRCYPHALKFRLTGHVRSPYCVVQTSGALLLRVSRD